MCLSHRPGEEDQSYYSNYEDDEDFSLSDAIRLTQNEQEEKKRDVPVGTSSAHVTLPTATPTLNSLEVRCALNRIEYM